MDHRFIERLSLALNPVLANFEQDIKHHLTGITTSIKILSQEVSVAKNDPEWPSHRQGTALQPLIGRLDRLEIFLGKPEGYGRPLQDRLRLIESRQEELLNRINRLEASRMSVLSYFTLTRPIICPLI
jgi:hypothetical protein